MGTLLVFRQFATYHLFQHALDFEIEPCGGYKRTTGTDMVSPLIPPVRNLSEFVSKKSADTVLRGD